jgi:uncharacterized repeat protein (TIGR03843 family)
MSARPNELTPAADDGVLALLASGSIEVVGRIPSSNLCLLVEVSNGNRGEFAVYKPESGERELWDFDAGLYRRERAAYVLSEWLGWGLVPPTVVRTDAPAGVGSLQRYVDAAESVHYFTLDPNHPRLAAPLRAMAAFDVVTNNADRKAGHVLLDPNGRVWGIDHGLCFSAPVKLRTVIWDFAEEPLPDELVPGLSRLAVEAPSELEELIEPEELGALQARARLLLQAGRFPSDRTGRRVPWPMV